MKRKLIVAIPLLTAVGVLAWLARPKRDALANAYVSERSVIVYNSAAQVREPMETLHYGDRVDVLGRRAENVKVRTASGRVGWIDSRVLLEPSLWERSIKLVERAETLPVQARGRTKVQTNLRIEPGRSAPRLYQFGRGFAVEIVGRAVADWAQGGEDKDGSRNVQDPKKEDWFLVRGVAPRASDTPDAANQAQDRERDVPLAGWVVARFVELDPPAPVREGITSANIRLIGWFELNRVPAASGEIPQYLVAGTRGPEGKACDFTMLRVYTWNLRRSRYETAFIENDLCGQMPVRISKGPKEEPEFIFHLVGTNEERRYRLMQTVVRRVREQTEADQHSRSRSPRSKP